MPFCVGKNKGIKKKNKIFNILFIFVFLVSIFFDLNINTAHATDAWWDASYGYRVKITVNASQVPSTQTNFPVYVNIANLPAGFFSHVQSDGRDIRVTNSTGTELAREIETINTGASTGVLWFKADSISDASYYYIYYGNESATEPVASADNGSQHVWDDGGSNYFKGVWHMGDVGPTTALDSTSNNNMTTVGSPTFGATGKIDGSVNFVNTPQSRYAYIPNLATYFDSETHTVSSWFKINSLTHESLFWAIRGGGEAFVDFGNYTTLYWGYRGGGGTYRIYSINNLGNTWHNIVTVKTGATTGNLYLDGVLQTSYTGNFDAITIAGNPILEINSFPSYENIYNLDAIVDEFRVSNTSRSGDWVVAEYNNQSSLATFYSVASEEIPMTAPDAPTSLTPTSGNTQISLSWTAPADDGGSAITDYVIDYKLTMDSEWSIFADGVSVLTSGIVTGLINGSIYDFRVSAVNVVGQGSASATATATPATLPDAPTIGTATAGNAQATVTFTQLEYDDWYNSDWGYRTKITIDHTKVPNTDQSYFPVLVNRTDLNWKDTTNNGHVGQSDGGDIVFTSSDGITQLDHEIEKYTSSTGEVIAWVKVPTLSTSADTDIYMYYGNASVADQWNITETWDDGGSNYYKGVWHMPNGTTLSALDSTGVNNGTNNGATATTGKVDGAGSFNGTSNYVGGFTESVFDFGGTFTLEAWVYAESTDTGYTKGVIAKETGGSNDGFAIGQYNNGWLWWVSGSSISTQTNFNLNNWHHIVGVYSGAGLNLHLYVDGQEVGTPTAATLVNNNDDVTIGKWIREGDTRRHWDGFLDDLKISSSARSADWIATEYNNQSSPSTFYSVASEENVDIPPGSGGSVITGYTATSNPGSIIGTGTSSPIVVTGLTNGTAYIFTVTATNIIGTGPASDSSNSVTPRTVPNVPTAVLATAGNAQVSLSWSAPAFDGGSAITDYVVEYKLTSDSLWAIFSDGISANTNSIVTGLTNGLSYDFRISAVNIAGQGSASGIVTATPITIPGAPISVTAIRGNTEAIISFSPPLGDGGSAITSYTVTSNPESHIGTGSTSPIIVTGLTNGTAYTFTVTATNIAGIGPASDPSNSVIPATVPDAPTFPVAIPGNAQVSLSWTAPVDNGGSVITDYVILYKLSSEPTVWSTFADGVSTNTNIIVTGLSNGFSYDFKIAAVNDVGQGSASSETNAMPITVPDAPTDVSAVAGNAEATISFTPPVFNGGSTINNYTITSSPGNFSATANSSPITVTGLSNGTAYTFTVVATNVVGNSLSSVASNSVTPVTVPDAPTAVSAVEGNAEATISFTAPLFDGGTPIILYTVTSNPGNFIGTGSSSPIVVTGLTNGTTYTFTVTATNAVGTSLPSSPSNSVTLFTEPGPPVNLALNVLGSSIGLSWSAPISNGGSVITDYVIEYKLTTGGVWAIFADGLNLNTTVTVVGLSNGTSYDFRVIAVNIIGQSVPSTIITATPGEPAQVFIQSFSDLTVSSIGTNVRITNEGAIEYEYQYTWCITLSDANLCGGGDDIFSASNAKSIASHENFDVLLTSTVLVPGDYYFHVKVLYGSVSSNAYQSFTALATFPDAPTDPVATAGNAQASVSFSLPAFDGGSAITGYTVTSSPGGIIGTGNGSPITVIGLTNGVSYTFTVTATNVMGTSLSSTPSNSIIPATVPDAPTNVSAIAGNMQVALSWTAPGNDGGSPIIDYVVEYKLASDSVWIIFADGISTLTNAIVTGLVNDLTYDFRISAVNAIGQSTVNTTNATLPTNTSSGGGGSSGYRPPSVPLQIENQIPEIIPTQETENKIDKITKTTKNDKNTKTTKNIVPIKTPSISPDTNKNEIQATPKEKIKVSIFPEMKISQEPLWKKIGLYLFLAVGLLILSLLVRYSINLFTLRLHKNKIIEIPKEVEKNKEKRKI